MNFINLITSVKSVNWLLLSKRVAHRIGKVVLMFQLPTVSTLFARHSSCCYALHKCYCGSRHYGSQGRATSGLTPKSIDNARRSKRSFICTRSGMLLEALETIKILIVVLCCYEWPCSICDSQGEGYQDREQCR